MCPEIQTWRAKARGAAGGRKTAGTGQVVPGVLFRGLVSGERATPALNLSPNLTPLSEVDRQGEGMPE